MSVEAYLVHAFNSMGSKGRLLRIRGRARLAGSEIGEGWAFPVEIDSAELSEPARVTIGMAWLMAAEMEHASIPAFSRLGDRLLPFTILGRGRRGLGSRERELARLATGSLVDGALGEGVAASLARVAAGRARNTTLRNILATIAAEEAEHAELAWSLVEWALAVGGASVAVALDKAVGRLSERLTAGLPALPGVGVALLREHGLPDEESRAKVASSAVATVVARATALLATAAAA